MEQIDDALVSGAVAYRRTKPRHVWVKWGAVAACLCLVLVAVAMISSLRGNPPAPQPEGIILSDKTTAKVSPGYDAGATGASQNSLVYLTEEELFAYENKYVFRGTVSDLTNVTIDFNGEKEARCIATIVISRVYQGDLTAGASITMLLPCAIDLTGGTAEDTGVITQLKSGMEGIFMPVVYDENACIEMNGAVLMKQDLAECGLADGMRWVFLNTEQGLVYLDSAYPGAKGATSLDDIEAYVMEMLRAS